MHRRLQGIVLLKFMDEGKLLAACEMVMPSELSPEERQQNTLGTARARSHCRFVLPLIHFIPESLTYAVPLFLRRQCGRAL
jgi:hypothetical protein